VNGCKASMSWAGISLSLGCYRDAGHVGLHKDLLGIWWASTDNRGVNSDGLTYDRPRQAPCSPAAEAPVLNTAQGAGSTPARGTTC
jgi:hypothetical protein